MRDRRRANAAPRLVLLLAVMLLLAGCGGSAVTKPCDDSDPVGPCATSHSQTHGGS